MAVAKFVRFASAPRFSHDCNKCRFLGTLEHQDLYVCEEGGSKTYTRRYGNEDHENGSLPAEAVSLLATGDCYKLAEKLDKLKRRPAFFVVR